jgi:hypothetical protein
MVTWKAVVDQQLPIGTVPALGVKENAHMLSLAGRNSVATGLTAAPLLTPNDTSHAVYQSAVPSTMMFLFLQLWHHTKLPALQRHTRRNGK